MAVVVGVGVGVALGWRRGCALAAMHDAPAETTVTVVMPFVAYLGAEHLHGSGVLAVLALGLYLRSYGHPAITAQGWLLGRAVWNYLDFLLTSLTFTLIGFELTTVLTHTDTREGTVALAVWCCSRWWCRGPRGCTPPSRSPARLQRRADAEVLHGWRETTVVTWAGMRGVVTVATALALPQLVASGAAFPHRAEIVLVALVCVLVTLVVQGLTLSPLVRWLGVGSEVDDGAAVAELRTRAAAAALEDLRAPGDAAVPDDVRRAVVLQYEVVRPRAAGALGRPDRRRRGGRARAARTAAGAGQRGGARRRARRPPHRGGQLRHRRRGAARHRGPRRPGPRPGRLTARPAARAPRAGALSGPERRPRL